MFDPLTPVRAETVAKVHDFFYDEDEIPLPELIDLCDSDPESVKKTMKELESSDVILSVSESTYEFDDFQRLKEYALENRVEIQIEMNKIRTTDIEDEITRCPNCNNAVVNDDRIRNGYCFVCKPNLIR